jgi:hypothetical protein
MDASSITIITTFLQENYLNIAIVVVITLGLIIFFSIKGWNLNPPKQNEKLIQQVTMETMETMEKTQDAEAEAEAEAETNALLGKNNLEYASGNDLDTLKELTKMKMTQTTSFCEQSVGDSSSLEQSCNELTADNCNATSCCTATFSNGASKCVAGGADGPTYKTDRNGKLITHEYYYFQNKCYGSGCPANS